MDDLLSTLDANEQIIISGYNPESDLYFVCKTSEQEGVYPLNSNEVGVSLNDLSKLKTVLIAKDSSIIDGIGKAVKLKQVRVA